MNLHVAGLTETWQVYQSKWGKQVPVHSSQLADLGNEIVIIDRLNMKNWIITERKISVRRAIDQCLDETANPKIGSKRKWLGVSDMKCLYTYMPLAFAMIVFVASAFSNGSAPTRRDNLTSCFIRPPRYLPTSVLLALISNVASALMSALSLSMGREVAKRFTFCRGNCSSSRNACRTPPCSRHSSSASTIMKALSNCAIAIIKSSDNCLSERRVFLPRWLLYKKLTSLINLCCC